MGWNGLYLDTNLAILPLSVRHTNISTLFSRAILQAVVARMSVAEADLAFFMDSYLTSL
jgi:hypothetical protein